MYVSGSTKLSKIMSSLFQITRLQIRYNILSLVSIWLKYSPSEVDKTTANILEYDDSCPKKAFGLSSSFNCERPRGYDKSWLN